MSPRSAHWLLLCVVLLSGACGSPPDPPTAQPPQVDESVPLEAALSHVGQLTVDLVPLRDGLAASSHIGVPRGVRRSRRSKALQQERSWIATAQRSPVLFRSRPEDCSSCAIIEADVEVRVSHFTPPLLAGQEPSSLGSGRAHVSVPVKVVARPSMTSPASWEVALMIRSGQEPKIEWTTALPETGSGASDEELQSLGDEVIRAEALLLPGRSTLMTFSAWRTAERDLQAKATSVLLSSTRLTVRLEVARSTPPGGLVFPPPSPVAVLGHDFQLQVRDEVASALAEANGLSSFRLHDARGRVGLLAPAGSNQGATLFGGTFPGPSQRPMDGPSGGRPRVR
jgi:hypothetical protein